MFRFLFWLQGCNGQMIPGNILNLTECGDHPEINWTRCIFKPACQLIAIIWMDDTFQALEGYRVGENDITAKNCISMKFPLPPALYYIKYRTYKKGN